MTFKEKREEMAKAKAEAKAKREAKREFKRKLRFCGVVGWTNGTFEEIKSDDDLVKFRVIYIQKVNSSYNRRVVNILEALEVQEWMFWPTGGIEPKHERKDWKINPKFVPDTDEHKAYKRSLTPLEDLDEEFESWYHPEDAKLIRSFANEEEFANFHIRSYKEEIELPNIEMVVQNELEIFEQYEADAEREQYKARMTEQFKRKIEKLKNLKSWYLKHGYPEPY